MVLHQALHMWVLHKHVNTLLFPSGAIRSVPLQARAGARAKRQIAPLIAEFQRCVWPWRDYTEHKNLDIKTMPPQRKGGKHARLKWIGCWKLSIKIRDPSGEPNRWGYFNSVNLGQAEQYYLIMSKHWGCFSIMFGKLITKMEVKTRCQLFKSKMNIPFYTNKQIIPHSWSEKCFILKQIIKYV